MSTLNPPCVCTERYTHNLEWWDDVCKHQRRSDELFVKLNFPPYRNVLNTLLHTTLAFKNIRTHFWKRYISKIKTLHRWIMIFVCSIFPKLRKRRIPKIQWCANICVDSCTWNVFGNVVVLWIEDMTNFSLWSLQNRQICSWHFPNSFQFITLLVVHCAMRSHVFRKSKRSFFAVLMGGH